MAFRFPVGPFCIGDPGGHYNGFSWEERCAVTPLQKEATRRGLIVQPSVCGVTGVSNPNDPRGDGYVFQHNEDYGRPLAFYAVARRVHSALHARFTDPLTWCALVQQHYVHGAWFTLLTMDPADMRRPFHEVYPKGLPAEGEVWPGLATAVGLAPGRFPATQAQATAQGVHCGDLFARWAL